MYQLLKHLLSNRFVRNVGWLGAAQLCIRVFRLATTVVLAKLLTPYDYGLAALVLTTNEFVNVFTKNGIWAKLVQVEGGELEEYCQTAYWANWMVCGSLCVFQCLVAFPVAWFYRDRTVILPICTMALTYLLLPVGLVHASLIQRESRLEVSAVANAVQVSIDNLLTMLFAFFGLGMWAIVLPKVLVSPIWVGIHRWNHPWTPPETFTLARWQGLFTFGRSIFGIEVLTTVRDYVDYLIVGSFVGIQALGHYYFAFNAGLGISMSAIGAIDLALYPHLCNARSDSGKLRQVYLDSLKTIAWIIVPLVLLQSSLAPLYVPLVFGSQWIPTIPVLILICLSALPRPFAKAASQSLWLMDKPQVDMMWNLVFTILFVVALLVGVQWDIFGVAAAVLLTHAIVLPIFTVTVSRQVLAAATSPVGEIFPVSPSPTVSETAEELRGI